MSVPTPSPGVPTPSLPLSRDDVKASLGAFADLGPQYSDEVIDSFLDKLNERLTTTAPASAPTYPTAAYTPLVQADVVRDAKGNPVRDRRGKVQFYPATVPVQAAAVPPQYGATIPVVPRENRPITPFAQRVSILAIILGAAIPLTAIAAGALGGFGFVIAWIGITIIAIVQAWSQKQ